MKQPVKKISPDQVESMFHKSNGRFLYASGSETSYDGLKDLHSAPKFKPKPILTDKGKKVFVILTLATFFFFLYKRNQSQSSQQIQSNDNNGQGTLDPNNPNPAPQPPAPPNPPVVEA